MATVQSACNFDWNLCIFCQRALSNVKTVCPAKSTRADVGSGYKSLAEAVEGCSQIGHLDVDFVNFWDDGDGIKATFVRHQVCWHAKCRSSLHPAKLARLRRHALQGPSGECPTECNDNIDESSSEVMFTFTRSAMGSMSDASHVCIFCDKEGKDLRQVMTWQVDKRVRKCAAIHRSVFCLVNLPVQT